MNGQSDKPAASVDWLPVEALLLARIAQLESKNAEYAAAMRELHRIARSGTRDIQAIGNVINKFPRD